MKFENQYLTYTEYKELKGLLEEVPFNLLEYDARRIIDERTQNRLIELKEIPMSLKLCVFKIIDILNKYQALESQNKAIASENIDGYSISYRKQELNDITLKNKEIEDVMAYYLADIVIENIPVLYLGVKDVS